MSDRVNATASVGRNASVSADARIQVRFGLHLGDVVVQRGVRGDGVNIPECIVIKKITGPQSEG